MTNQMKPRFIRYSTLIVLAILTISVAEGRQSFTIEQGKFLLHGKPFQIISGEMHYLRIPPEYWKDRLLKARAMGLNTIATYVFWNMHEPKKGEFNFSGSADVAGFVRMAQAVGLYVILRPGPYACAEWDFGGFPSWLLKDHDLEVRSRDPRFLSACESYLLRLGKELAPLQITRGGPIIMVQVENEYGSYGNDTVYEGRIRDLIKGAGFDVPLFTADGPAQMPNAVLTDVLPAVNGAVGNEILTSVQRYRPEGPFFVPEFYPGWLDHWGEPHAHVDAAKSAEELDWILSHGISVNLYMFHGGTNFGFTNGANYGGSYQPQPTSYDYDAPLDEAGRATPKYLAYRSVIARHLGDSVKLPPVPPANRVISIPPIPLLRSAALLDVLPDSIASPDPLSMEDVGQSSGYILYRTRLEGPRSGELSIGGLNDYGVVLLNGKEIASLDRRHRQHALHVNMPPGPAVLDILVENGGRINYGREILRNRKGITGKVTLDSAEIRGWNMFPLAMERPPSLHFGKRSSGHTPAFFEGTFILKDTGDSFLDMRAWDKGCVWVNGHNLGRYWYIGPQQTLYLPGVWLRRGRNQVVVFALEGAPPKSIAGIKEPILNVLKTDRLKPPKPKRQEGRIRLDTLDLVARGAFADGPDPQDVTFTPLNCRYICLESLSSQKSDPFASIAELDLLDPSGRTLPHAGWKVAAVDCEELDEEDGRAENAFDGDPETIWHTLWGGRQPPHPHYIVIDIGHVTMAGGFRYLPRMGTAPGRIKDFRFFAREMPFLIQK